MVAIQPFTETETKVSFTASCIDMAARRLGCSYLEAYERMQRVGLVHAYLDHLDALHTQSREYITNEVVETLLRLEKEREGKE